MGVSTTDDVYCDRCGDRISAGGWHILESETVHAECLTLVERAEALGREHGHNAGTWFEAWTDEQWSEILIADQDGSLFDLLDPPAPLSGEWADGMTLGSLYHEVTGNDPDEEDETGMALMDDLARAYEQAYSDAWRDEVLRMARYQVGES